MVLLMVLLLASTNPLDILACIMMRIQILSLMFLCLCVPSLCPAQRLIPTIQLSADETAKAKQVTEELKNAQVRLDKASADWDGFRKSFQAEHPDLRNLRFSSNLQTAFAHSDEELAPGVKQATSVELKVEELRKLEALVTELTESQGSLKQAQNALERFPK
jgi:chemotaxis protein histidine kinase CheA